MLTRDASGTALTATAVFMLLYVVMGVGLTSSLAVALVVVVVGGAVAARRVLRGRHPSNATESLRGDLVWAAASTAGVVLALIVLYPTQPVTIVWLGGLFALVALAVALVSWWRGRRERGKSR